MRALDALAGGAAEGRDESLERVEPELAALPEDERPGTVLVAVFTDGHENSSVEANGALVKALVERQQGKWGWQFTYLGANQDAVLTAGGLGIKAEDALTYAAGYTTHSIPLTSAYIAANGPPPILALNTVGVTGSIKLTENLRLSYNLGYDITHQTVTYPNITFFRDLHCWQVNGTWIPFGLTKGYNFTIAAKSSLLQDLKLNRNRYAQYQ